MNSAHNLIDVNIRALQQLQRELPTALEPAVLAIAARMRAHRKIIVTGIGKSFHVAQKIAATLTSTGSAAFALHPGEAMHGDLGMVQHEDVLIALSFSGETEELLTLLPFTHERSCLVVAITGNPNSALARAAHHLLPVPLDREACPFNLAPTTSALLSMAVGDVLATLLHQELGFTEADYARLHPGGAIGNAIYLKVADVMRTGKRVAELLPDTSLQDALFTMTECRTGAMAVVEKPAGKVIGILTDGDVRRSLVRQADAMQQPVRNIMTPDPIAVADNELAVELVKVFERHNINDIVIVNANGCLVGMIDIQDMPKVKLL